jgi:hypothetical protein
MSAISYDRHRSHTSILVKGMTAVNLAFSLALLLGWRQLAPYLEDPVLKLAGSDVARDSSIFAYPFVILWCMPLLGVAGVIIARSFDSKPLARFIALYPALVTLACCGWFYLLSDYYG